MKIKRKEYERLTGRLRELETIAALRFKVKVRHEDGSLQMLQDESVEEVSKRSAIWEGQANTLPTWWIGDMTVSFERRIPGYEHFLVAKYQGYPINLNVGPFGVSTSLPVEYWEDGGEPDAPYSILERVTFHESTPEGDTETLPATEPDSGTVPEVIAALATKLSRSGTGTDDSTTANDSLPTSSVPIREHKNPPFPPYYSAHHDDIDLRENQALTCLTLSQIDSAEGEEQVIHICDVPAFIAKLSAFQEFRSQLPKYKET